MTATKTKAEKGSYVDEATKESAAKQPERTVDVSKIKPGDLMLFGYWGKVAGVQHGPVVEVQGLAGAPSYFHVQGKDLAEAAFSADQYASTEKLPKTKVAEILTTAYNRPFTVCFNKLDGTERVLRGRLVEPEPLLGRSHVEDLDITTGHALRLVDHRTLKWLIVGGIRYEVK